jgi:NitT/TauT family transport system permease protein
MSSVMSDSEATGRVPGLSLWGRFRVLMEESAVVSRLIYSAAGIGVLMALWWLGGYLLAVNPDTAYFSALGPGPTLVELWGLIQSASLYEAIAASLYRLGLGLLWAIGLGVPIGVAVGYFRSVREMAHVPFQFLRMISPLSWMPIAVLVFPGWEQAIIFLICMAAVWPIIFSTAYGVQRIDPLWLKVAHNMGADHLQTLRRIIMPAIAADIFSGIRLALGVAWIVLVPAEYLGVTSGLGYAISDARDTMSYATLSSMVVVIGIIGFLLDGIWLMLIKRFSWQPASF